MADSGTRGFKLPTAAAAEHAVGVRKVTWIGFVINISLAALKLVCGVLGRSQAVVADAVHSLSDCATDVAILVGVRYWIKPPDDCHPHGHRRIETVVTVLIGVSLAGVAIGLGFRAIATLLAPNGGTPGWIALVAAGISIVTKEALYRWTVIVGRRVKSSAVVANAWHHRSDAFSSIPAFIAVGGALLIPAWTWLDHLGAIVVSLFILHSAFAILRPAYNELIDAGAPALVRRALTALAEGVPGVREVHGLRTRFLGDRLHVDLHVQVDPQLTVQEGHVIGGKVKYKLLHEGPEVADVLVHLEPFEEGN
jgi:cation diffusion facilitator family transporter